jgi:hypothetical protein
MGFLDFVNRMVQGKPVFEDSSTQKPSSNTGQSLTNPEPLSGINKADEHTFPVVKVTKVINHEDSTKLRIYCRFLNTWPEEIMLDKIRLLGTTRELDSFLRGGEDHEFLVYDGPKLQKEYHEAQLDYKTQREADYFQATFDVVFNYHGSDKTYTVSEMHLRQPIRDIYG